MTTSNKIVLIACGSFNPITPMHLRMFELARDQIYLDDKDEVIGGVVSPVHDEYKKQELVSSNHRVAMVKLALQSSNWVRLSEWETQQKGWTRTRMVLQHHQNMLNAYLKEKRNNNYIPGWLPEEVKNCEQVRVQLLCGADVLESFKVPGLWKEEDIEAILSQHGIAVVTRSEANVEKAIFESDLLSKYRKNIKIVTNWAINDLSSTLCRRLIRRGLSVKYLLDDLVTEYIMRNRLYKSTNKNLLTPNRNTPMLISPPNDEFLDNYIAVRNIRNSSRSVDDENEESMDETDRAAADETTVSSDLRPRTYVNRPGGAVKVNRGETIVRRTMSTPTKVKRKRRKVS